MLSWTNLHVLANINAKPDIKFTLNRPPTTQKSCLGTFRQPETLIFSLQSYFNSTRTNMKKE